RRDVSSDMREKAIFWLGQNRSTENADFLKGLFSKVETEDLKEKIIFSLSQMGGGDNYRWLMDIALNPKEDIEIRKKALFWAGQGHNVDVADLVRLYDSMNDREMKEQLIFVYSQRREDAALDKLFDIGKNDPDRELRKKAIFWIGQSRSPRAAQYLQELSKSGGRIIDLRVYVGGEWRASTSATDLGMVSTKDAASYLLALALRDESRAAEKAIFPAVLADSVTIWPDLLKIAKSDDVSRK